MDQRVRYIVIFTVCIILCNQIIHLYRLYKEEKTEYIHQQNNLINGAIYEFSTKRTSFDNSISYNALTNELILRFKKQRKRFQLSEKDDIRKICEQSRYDIRDPQLWTLKNFYAYLQTKRDSTHTKNLSIQLAIQDSIGQIKDTYPEHFKTLPLSPEYCEPLGFISGDTLYATYNFPILEFIETATWEIILTIMISILFIICVINLYQTIRNEKKSGEYRELFINNLVHDLKRPVENQVKTCYILSSLPPDKQNSFLERNQKQLTELLQSINRMLLESTDAHGLRLTVGEFDLKEMLEALTQKECWNTEAEKQFDIQTDFRSDHPIITGDYHFLFAVFQNFIDNALKYSGEQVNIQITCTDAEADHVQIRIEDNGFGISSGNLKHIFERYNRGDHQSNRKIKGHGQGLHYARTVILAHGGRINIESEEGKGTTVIVTLPRKANIKNKYKH